MGYLKQPCNTAGCGPCGSGATPSITSFACVSRTGSGNLRGWSKFQNHNSGDLNKRKSTRFDISPWSDHYIDFYSTSPANCAGAVQGSAIRKTTSTTALWNVSTNTLISSARIIAEHCGSEVSGTDYTAAADWFPCAEGGASAANITDWIRRLTCPGYAGAGCLSGGPYCGVYTKTTDPALAAGRASDGILSVFDTVAAAQARGSPTVGASCQTLPGTIGSTSARSATQIAITNPTSVVSSITCGDLVSGTTYEITASLTRRASADDAFISTGTVTITFIADGTTDTVDYDVPVETGTKVNFDSADSIVAA